MTVTTVGAPPRAQVMSVVAAGGVLGSLGRYGVGELFPHEPGTIPVGTLTVNLTGAFAIGLFLSWLTAHPEASPLARPFVAVGVLGGWTTYSALAVESLAEAVTGNVTLGLVYLVGSLILGVVLVILAEAVGEQLWGGGRAA